MLDGQRKALERLCDASQAASRHSMLIHAEHDTPIPLAIDVAEARVVKRRYQKKWVTPTRAMSVRQLVDKFKSWKARQQ
jgi:hypothetical protein